MSGLGRGLEAEGQMDEQAGLDEHWIAARVLDLTGLKCPMPSLMTAKALRNLPAGVWVVVTVTDALAPLDLRHLCQKDGHTVVDERMNENGAQLLIRSGPRA
jgi:tRNA 2-thiouridine synthesizing protein A